MSDRREDGTWPSAKRPLFRKTNICKKLTQYGTFTLQSSQQTHTLIAGGLLIVSSLGASALLVSLVPSKVALCCLCIIIGLASFLYIMGTLSATYVRKYGIVSSLPEDYRLWARELLLKTSCMDLIFNSYSDDFGKISDFFVSLTLPMTAKERKRVIKSLPKNMQQALRRNGLIHLLPRNVQTILFPEVLFKRPLPTSSVGSSADVQQQPLTQENLLLHDENNSRDGSAEIELDSGEPLLNVPIRRSNRVDSVLSFDSDANTQNNLTPVFGGLLDRRMHELSYQIARGMAGKPFGNLSDRELTAIAAGSSAVSVYFVWKSPRLKKVIYKTSFYFFIFLLLASGSGAFLELLFRSKRLRKKVQERIKFLAQLFRYSLRTLLGTSRRRGPKRVSSNDESGTFEEVN